MTAIAKRQPQPAAVVLKDRVNMRLREAEAALLRAVDVKQVKLVADVAAAQKVLAQRQQLGDDVIGYAHAIRIEALARLGELLKAIPKASGGTHGGRRTKLGSRREPSSVAPQTLKDLGLTKKVSHIAQQLAALPTAKREAIKSRKATLAQASREIKAVEIRKAVAAPDAKYRILYADPPWSYNDKADAGSVQGKGAEHHYPAMSIAQLCALPVPEWCTKDAALFLWVTSPLLFESAAVIKAWGFTYKASFVWDKVKHNMGHYNSVRHEFLLICTKGSCVPDNVKLFDSVQSIERTTHSTKPEEFRRIIETLYPHGRRLEMFARKASDGWDAWGNQADQGKAS